MKVPKSAFRLKIGKHLKKEQNSSTYQTTKFRIDTNNF